MALEKKELSVSEAVIVCKMMCSFILRDLDKAEKIAREYLDFFEQNDSGPMQYVNIHRYYYGGLIAFHCFRNTQDEYWKEIGLRSISKFEKWNNECQWNFENKLLLLQAEQHFAIGDTSKAKFTYNMAITSAREHRFLHEEALSCELAGAFYHSIEEREQSIRLLKQALSCYESWCATEKANALKKSLKEAGYTVDTFHSTGHPECYRPGGRVRKTKLQSGV